MTRRVTALTAAAATFAIVAASATAGVTSTRSGTTAEGVVVKLELGEFGNPTSFTVGKTKIKCSQGGTLTTRKATYTKFVTSDPGAFELRQKSKSTQGPFTFKGVAKATGESTDPALENWTGTLREKTRVFRRGEKIDTCRLNTTWDAN